MASQFSQHHLLNSKSFPHCLFLSGLSKIGWLLKKNILTSAAMADSRSGTGKVQNKPGMFYNTRVQGGARRLVGVCQKDDHGNIL